MENKINWNKKDYLDDYNLYDEYFLSFHFDHIGLCEDKWKELVKKFGLNTKVVINESNDITICNDDQNIVITGNNCGGIPGYYLMLTFSINIDIRLYFKFFMNFMRVLDHYDDLSVREGIMGEYTEHPKEIIQIMIDKL